MSGHDQPPIIILLGSPPPVAGVVVSETKERFTIRQAAEKGLITSGEAVALLEAQTACGFIIHGLSGDTMTVDEAIDSGLIMERRQEIIKRAEKAIFGFTYKCNVTGDEKTTGELGHAKSLMPQTHALRLMEAQYATGGIIDFKVNCRRTLEQCVELGLITPDVKLLLEEGKQAEFRFDVSCSCFY